MIIRCGSYRSKGACQRPLFCLWWETKITPRPGLSCCCCCCRSLFTPAPSLYRKGYSQKERDRELLSPTPIFSPFIYLTVDWASKIIGSKAAILAVGFKLIYSILNYRRTWLICYLEEGTIVVVCVIDWTKEIGIVNAKISRLFLTGYHC